MAFDEDIKKEYNNIRQRQGIKLRQGAISLFGDLVENSPVDTGELRDSWQPPQKLGVLNWRISNIAPHAYIIDGGRRQAIVKGTMKWIGSEQLPKGFQPIVDKFEPKLQRELDKIK